MGIDIAFWILAIIGVIGALGVIFLKNVFHTALSLILCLLTVAGIYVTLSADFLAAVQILIYVGGISILVILVKVYNAQPSLKCSTTLATASSTCFLYGSLTGFLVP